MEGRPEERYELPLEGKAKQEEPLKSSRDSEGQVETGETQRGGKRQKERGVKHKIGFSIWEISKSMDGRRRKDFCRKSCPNCEALK